MQSILIRRGGHLFQFLQHPTGHTIVDLIIELFVLIIKLTDIAGLLRGNTQLVQQVQHILRQLPLPGQQHKIPAVAAGAVPLL